MYSICCLLQAKDIHSSAGLSWKDMVVMAVADATSGQVNMQLGDVAFT